MYRQHHHFCQEVLAQEINQQHLHSRQEAVAQEIDRRRQEVAEQGVRRHLRLVLTWFLRQSCPGGGLLPPPFFPARS
jgi:hypothetical protein